MNRLHTILAALALAIVPVVGAAVCVVLLQLSSLLKDAERDEHLLAVQAGLTLTLVNQDCGTEKDIHPCGTLADINQTLHAARGTLGGVEVATKSFNTHSTALYAQEQSLFGEVHDTIGAANGTLASVQETAKGATEALAAGKTTIAGLQPVEQALTQAMSSLNAVVSQPSIPQLLTKAVAIEDNAVLITSDGRRITKDAADEADKLAHPPKKKLTFWGGTDATMLYIHSHVMPPLF